MYQDSAFCCSASRSSSSWDQPVRAFLGLKILEIGGQTRSRYPKEDRKMSIPHTTHTHTHTYHAVGNYYLKHSWEYFTQNNCITYSCILGAPSTLGKFLFAKKHRLERICQTYSDIGGSRNTLGKKCISMVHRIIT